MIFNRAIDVWELPTNPASKLKLPKVRTSAGIDVLDPDEVRLLVAHATDDKDAAAYTTAAMAGLRQGELLALRWRDVDFAASAIRVVRSLSHGKLTSPKSGAARTVPMAPDVATALAKLSQRRHHTGDDDLVFCDHHGQPLAVKDLRDGYRAALAAAELRPLRFHDLRHTFGTVMIAKADIRRVQEWMGHADVQTTMRYLHYAPRDRDAALVAEAFAARPIGFGDAGDVLGHRPRDGSR
jgi:integrase